MRLLLTVAVLLIAASAVHAQGPAIGPPYQRMRTGADDWQARGGPRQNWRGGYGPGFGGFHDPFFFTPPIVTGSWYQRPYPYHFDYYRYRWGGPPNGYGTASEDCPCATPPPVEVVE